MTYHYWINDKDGTILSLYNLQDKGEILKLNIHIYKTTDTKNTNTNITLSENKIISSMNILESYNVVVLSEKCRFIFNDKITLLEMDGKNIDVAFNFFLSLATETPDDNVLFFIDDDIIHHD